MQLAVLLRSRVALHTSLRVLARQAPRERQRKIVEGLMKDIEKGSTLAGALRAQSETFDEVLATTAEIGEETGRLEKVLEHHADYLSRLANLRRKFMQALAYPVLVLSVAAGAVSFLLLFIVPAFAEMFRSFQMELPLSTKIVLSTSDLFAAVAPYVLILLPLAVLLLTRLSHSRGTFESLIAFGLKIPFFKTLLIKNFVARFCRSLGTLIEAQVPLVEALHVTQRMFPHQIIGSDIKKILQAVKQGRPVADPLIDSKVFPPLVVQMIAVGEETSELDAMLIRVADFYERELESIVDSLSTVIEPIIIVFLGLLVAAILISMYLPLFDLVNIVGGI